MTSTEERTAAAAGPATVPGAETTQVGVLPRGEVDFGAQPRLRRNDYAPLTPPPLGEWTPTLSVSVVIPAHGHPDNLALVMDQLAAHSCPAHPMAESVVTDG